MRTSEPREAVVRLPSEPAGASADRDPPHRGRPSGSTGPQRADPDRSLPGVAGGSVDGDGGVALARRLTPDVVILDVKVPGGGPNVARRIKAEVRSGPPAHLLGVRRPRDGDRDPAAPSCYLVKGTAPEEVLEAIHRTGEGSSSLSVEIYGKVIEEQESSVTRAETLAAEVRELDRLKSR